MISDINICNMGLANIGVLPITSFDEQTQQARLCSSFYSHIRDFLQASYSWNFNRKECPLVQDAEFSAPNWEFAYVYPKDVLAVIRVYPVGMMGSAPREEKISWGTDYEQQGQQKKLFDVVAGEKKRICTDIDNAWATVRCRIEDVNMFPIGFSEVLAWGLSLRVALALTKSEEMAGMAREMYERALGMALVTSASEGYGYNEQPTSWFKARE